MKVTIDTENKTLTILDLSFKIEELFNFISEYNLQDYTVNNNSFNAPILTIPSTYTTSPIIKDLDYNKINHWTTTSTSDLSK